MRGLLVVLVAACAARFACACGGLAAQGGGTPDAGKTGPSDGAAHPDSRAARETGAREVGGPMTDAPVTGASCGAGTVTLTTKVNDLLSIAIDPSNVYWTDDFPGPADGPTTGPVKSVPLSGGAPKSLIGALGVGESDVATDSTALYAFQVWLAHGVPNPLSFAVVRKPLAGGTPATLVRVDPPFTMGGFALNATHLYWSTNTLGDHPPKTISCALMGLELPAGSPVTVMAWTGPECTWDAFAVAADDQNLYWVSVPSTGSTAAPGAVLGIGLSGGSAVTLASGQNNPSSLVISGANVYWIDNASPWATTSMGPNPGQVMTVPTGGGTPVTLADDVSPCALAVDGTSVYWTDTGTARGQILKVSLGGGAPTTVACPITASVTCPLAVDATSVYWGTYPPGSSATNKGALMKSPK